jgi:chromosome segregation protein
VEREATTARVRLAKAEQVLEGVQTRLAQLHSEHDEQLLSIAELTEQLDQDALATEEAKERIKTGFERLGELNAQRETVSVELAEITQARTEVDNQRRHLNQKLSEKREQLRTVDERLHQLKMRAEQLEMQRLQLVERLQDDYGIDITCSNEEPVPENLPERDQIDQEISHLRKKVSDIGAVNLDALQELEELEARYLSMDAQYQDLVKAKETLEKIIVRIDADSRKLFVETLEAIRTNFQRLFRQTFGGGQADLILEDGVDPLEAGVEVIATPPGKSQFSNSLLSGGEKALTAVSLLMAIFQFRPSPFCVLDEVDAPFDEANIGRFIDVLRSFLGWTRFVIVTHSKKTMTAATTLYGITMQESGVSKRVSVRFEDVSEDGEISKEAVHRSDEDAA